MKEPKPPLVLTVEKLMAAAHLMSVQPKKTNIENETIEEFRDRQKALKRRKHRKP